jgi:hypothetical protein
VIKDGLIQLYQLFEQATGGLDEYGQEILMTLLLCQAHCEVGQMEFHFVPSV